MHVPPRAKFPATCWHGIGVLPWAGWSFVRWCERHMVPTSADCGSKAMRLRVGHEHTANMLDGVCIIAISCVCIVYFGGRNVFNAVEATSRHVHNAHEQVLGATMSNASIRRRPRVGFESICRRCNQSMRRRRCLAAKPERRNLGGR